MYLKKAAFFDHQVNESWAANEYGEQEEKSLKMLFSEAGSLEKMKILEPGCGTGRLTRILADRAGPDGLVVAMDISFKMVSAARKKLAGRKNVQIYLAAVEDLKFMDNSFDMIICHQVFPHFENKKKVLLLMQKMLKKGGKLIIHHFISLEQINDVHRKAGTAVQNDIMPNSEKTKTLFKGAGFQIIFIRDGEDGYFLNAVKL